MSKRLLVILDGPLLDWFGKSERRLATRIANCAVSGEAFLEHSQQHRDLSVHVVMDPHLGLRRVAPVESAAVLDQRSFPRDGHGEKERIEPSIVEPFTDVTTCPQDHPLGHTPTRTDFFHPAVSPPGP